MTDTKPEVEVKLHQKNLSIQSQPELANTQQDSNNNFFYSRNDYNSVSSDCNKPQFKLKKLRVSTRDSFSNCSMQPSQTLKFKDQNNINKTFVSYYTNFPSYSINQKKVSYKQIISKQHVQDAIGQESPGVGRYSPTHEGKQRAPTWKIGSSMRFDEINRVIKNKSHIPVAYLNQNGIGRRSLSFTRAERFRDQSPKAVKETEIPGPGAYETIAHKSISSLLNDQYTQQAKSLNRTLYKMPRQKNKRVYFPEYAGEFINQEGPGPQVYKYESINSSFNFESYKGIGFSKADRRIFLPRNKDERPLHYADRDQEVKLLSNQSFYQGRATFSRAQRSIDVTKMNGLHADLWKRGLKI